MGALTSDGLIRGERYRISLDDCCVQGAFTGTFLGLGEDGDVARFDTGSVAVSRSVSFEPVHDLPWDDQVLMDVENLDAEYDETKNRRRYVDDPELANVVTSWIADGDNGRPAREPRERRHRPVLDLDMPVYVLPSSTPGHSHVFIDHDLTWPAYRTLLNTLAGVGLVEQGYVDASEERGHTAVRVPWVRKGAEEDTEQLATPTEASGLSWGEVPRTLDELADAWADEPAF